MHEIAKRAIEGTEPIEKLVEDFYGPQGPLAARGWEIRPMQCEMSLDIARQFDSFEAQSAFGADGKQKRGERGRFTGRKPTWGIVEAPCGTGKGMGYAVPGLLAALRCRAQYERAVEELKAKGEQVPPGWFPKKLVITTANIALQEQLVRKDLPALCEMLDLTTVRVVLLKGRNNYLCRWKIRTMGGAFNPHGPAARVLEWMRDPGCTGDRETVPFDPGEVWADVSATTEECLGAACQHYSSDGDGSLCYWREAIQGFNHAHVIVTNHHYVALAKGLTNCLLAVDEMHELESSLRATQTRSLTPMAGRWLCRKLAPYLAGEGELHEHVENRIGEVLDRPVQWLMGEAAAYYDRAMVKVKASSPNGKAPEGTPAPFKGQWLAAGDEDRARAAVVAMNELAEEVEKVATDMGCFRDGDMMHPPRYKADDPELAERAGKLAKLWMQMRSLIERFETVALGEPPPTWPGSEEPWALYFERYKTKGTGEERTIAQMCPADVSWATAALAGAYPVAVFTSATVPDFPSLRLALGLGTAPEGKGGAPAPTYEKRLPSPYPLREMGVLVVPAGPSPKDEGWGEWAVCTVLDAVKLAGGGTLVLASSTRMMWQYFKALEDKSFGCGYPVKVQGSMGRGELREWFKSNEDNGVLVATRSFFQGLDVQGDNCRLVIIDRVPFSRPDDPVEQAVQQLLVERAGGGSGYLLRSVPEAAMVLAQGAGRLIRSQSDRGAVVLLDKRVLSEGDGWRVLRSALPPFPVSRDLEDVRRVLQREALAGVAPPPRGRTLRRGTGAP